MVHLIRASMRYVAYADRKKAIPTYEKIHMMFIDILIEIQYGGRIDIVMLIRHLNQSFCFFFF